MNGRVRWTLDELFLVADAVAVSTVRLANQLEHAAEARENA